jgi:hypothetical protein
MPEKLAQSRHAPAPRHRPDLRRPRAHQPAVGKAPSKHPGRTIEAGKSGQKIGIFAGAGIAIGLSAWIIAIAAVLHVAIV